MDNNMTKAVEMNRIWQNTRRYRTAQSEIAALCDLYAGLEKSGYAREKFQRYDHLHNCTYFVVFERDQLEGVLANLAAHKSFDFDNKSLDTRLNREVYFNQGLGMHPSSILTADDILANPMLLALLAGEVSKHEYFDGNIVENSNGIVIKRYKQGRQKPEPLSCAEAAAAGREFAESIVKLNDLTVRAQSEIGLIYFESEKGIGGNLDLSYERSIIKVKDRAVFQDCVIADALMKLTRLSRRLQEVQGQITGAEDEIRKGIEQHMEAINKHQGPYFPYFAVIKSPS